MDYFGVQNEDTVGRCMTSYLSVGPTYLCCLVLILALGNECSLPQSLLVQRVPNDLKGGYSRNAGPM
jgi:hypothetical protein